MKIYWDSGNVHVKWPLISLLKFGHNNAVWNLSPFHLRWQVDGADISKWLEVSASSTCFSSNPRRREWPAAPSLQQHIYSAHTNLCHPHCQSFELISSPPPTTPHPHLSELSHLSSSFQLATESTIRLNTPPCSQPFIYRPATRQPTWQFFRIQLSVSLPLRTTTLKLVPGVVVLVRRSKLRTRNA